MRAKKGNIVRFANVTVLGSILSLSLFIFPAASSSSNVAVSAAEEKASLSDEQQIRSTADDYAKAFTAGNADVLADLCADECCYTDPDGVQYNGRVEIKKMYEKSFSTFGPQPISISITKIFLPTSDVAIEDGQTTYAKTSTVSRYSVVHIKKNGAWKMLRINETFEKLSATDALKSLSWMIGDWTLHGQNKNVFLRVSPINNGNFLSMRFSDANGSDVAPQQLQIIGWSAKTEDIVSWNFGHEGGIGYGHWRKEGDTWFITTHGVTGEGDASAADYIVKHPDNDHFSWQSLGRSINGTKLPNMSLVEATRQQATK